SALDAHDRDPRAPAWPCAVGRLARLPGGRRAARHRPLAFLPHRTRARGRAARRAGGLEPRDRRGALPLRPHGRGVPRPRVPQARGDDPGRARGARARGLTAPVCGIATTFDARYGKTRTGRLTSGPGMWSYLITAPSARD